MALIIDPGTFLVGNSFVTMDESDSFHTVRLNETWLDADPLDKEAALIRAFDYLSIQNWKTDAFLSGIPLKIKNAQCIAGLKELTSPGTMQPDITTGIKRESIDGVSETEYFGSSSISHTAVENLIKPYIKRPGMRMTMVRG